MNLLFQAILDLIRIGYKVENRLTTKTLSFFLSGFQSVVELILSYMLSSAYRF